MLACFDTERHGHSLFPPLFTPGKGIPLCPSLCPPALHIPLRNLQPPTHLCTPTLTPQSLSSTSFARLDLSTLAFSATGAFTPASQPAVSTRPCMLFSLYLGCQKFIHRDRGCARGQNRFRAECDRRDEEGGGSLHRAAPGQLGKPSTGCLESREPTEQHRKF